ncbi:MAG: NYN domain-containing protein [Chloroflexi bacterium]|nr:NYN domain-containing protein [Chloroflexota bacterium]
MPYLIDGHNLIGQTPGLSLEDPDDEAKLVQLIKRFCSRHKKKATVIFDRGLPGGESRLSGAGVEVRFASSSSSADALIRNRLGKLRDPKNWTVVTSDGEVAQAARSRGTRVRSSTEFAAELTAPVSDEAEKEEKQLSKEEVSWWEELFRQKKE